MHRASDPIGRIRSAGVALLLLMLIGIAGFGLIENYGFVDGFYMTVITMGTVGFTEVHPLHDAGKIFTSFLILASMLIVAYAAGATAQILLEGKLFTKRRRERRVQQMKDHIIVCGFGRIGQRIARHLQDRKVPFVVIERDEGSGEDLRRRGYNYIDGNAVDEEVLQRAGIERAHALVAALNSDADNVYVALTARSMNPRLYIVARSADPASEQKLRRAGADKVVSPYEIGGAHMANALLRPHVVDFMELVTEGLGDRAHHLEIDEIPVPAASAYAGKSLRECPIRSEMNIIVLAIKAAEGVVEYNPSPERMLAAGDMLICIGFTDKLDQLARVIQS